MNYNFFKSIFKSQMRSSGEFPSFKVGDEIKVYWLNKDGKKARTDFFSGLVIVKKGFLNAASFILRKVIAGVGVEKRFHYHSPLLQKIEILKKGKVRRAKLYYIRQLRGRLARIKRQA